VQTLVPKTSTARSITSGEPSNLPSARPTESVAIWRGAIERGFKPTLIQRSAPDGYIWVHRYSPALDDALRSIVRDERATESQRVWALGVLDSWGIRLDPALYPLVAEVGA
jgi:hypothetical protein